MFVRNGKQAVWPFVLIGIIVLCFIPWIMDRAGYELMNVDMTNPVMKYLILTWLPTVGNILIVALLLVWFGAPMVSNMLVDRKAEIEKSIDEAAHVKFEAQTKYQDAEEKLDRLDEEVESLKTSYARTLEEEKERIAEETARQEARIEADANAVFELRAAVAQRAFEREVMASALEKARVEIIEKVNADASLRDRLIDQGIASLRINA